MKKLLLPYFYLFPLLSFSQYAKKAVKKLKKMELKIGNRGLDLAATFVPGIVMAHIRLEIARNNGS